MCMKFHANNIQLQAAILRISPSHTRLIILIRFITLKNNCMNPCAKTEGKWIYSKNTDESLDECRRVTDECMQVQTSVDESLDECRQMWASVDKSKIFFFNSRKSDKWSHFVVVAIMQQQATSVCGLSILQFYL